MRMGRGTDRVWGNEKEGSEGGSEGALLDEG